MFKQVSYGGNDHWRVFFAVVQLEYFEDWEEEVFVNDHHDVAVVFGAKDGLVEFYDFDVYQAGVDVGELNYNRYDLVLDHELLEGVAVLGHHLVYYLHD